MPFAAAGALASVASAGVGIAGALSGGSSKSSSGSGITQSLPWGGQGPSLAMGFGRADDVFNERLSRPVDAYYAPPNSYQSDANSALYNSAANAGDDAHWGMLQNSGRVGLSGANYFRDNAASITGNGIGPRDPSLSSLLTNYAQTGQLPGQPSVDPTLQSYINGGQFNGIHQVPTGLAGDVAGTALGNFGNLASGGYIASNAGLRALDPRFSEGATLQGTSAFMNNDVLNGQINAIGTDISRNLNETTLPGIRAAAQASGNLNSSREGALEAIAGRGANENLANASANLRGSAYNNALQVANNQNTVNQTTSIGAANSLNANGTAALAAANTWQGLGQQQNQFDQSARLQAINSAAQQGQFGIAARLGADNSAAGQNLGWNTANAAAQLGANAQLGSGVQMGNAALAAGLNGSLSADLLARGAGDYAQQLDQGPLTAQDSRTQGLLNDYWNIVSRGYNGANTSTTSSNQSSGGGLGGALQGGLGGALTGLGLADKLTGGQASGSLQNGIYNLFNPNPYGGNTGSAGDAGTSALQGLGFFNPLT